MLSLSRYIRPWLGYIGLTSLIKLLGAATELMIPYLMAQQGFYYRLYQSQFDSVS